MHHNLFLFHSNYFAITRDCFQPESEIKLFGYWNRITIEMLSLSALLLGCDLSPPQIRGQFIWKKDCPFIYPLPNDFQIHKDDWVTEWVDLGFSRERAEIAEYITAPPGYISDNVVAFGLCCNFLEDEVRCDRWRSWWKSCRGRGQVAPPPSLRWDWSRQGHEEGLADTFTFILMHFFCRNTAHCKTHRTLGQAHAFSICKSC